ncbi:MAG: hypothetical protein ACSW8H_04535, partial [bacterium]
MKAFLKKWIGPLLILVTLTIVLIVGIVNGTLMDAVRAVMNANPVYMALCLLCYAEYMASDAIAIKSFLRRMGYSLRMRDSMA